MKKKFIAGIFSLLLYNNLFADILLDQMRANQLTDYITNLDSMYNYSNEYILSNGDITPTLTELSTSYSLASNFFSNFDNSSNVSISLDSINKTFTISNVLGSNPNEFVVTSFLNSSTANKVTSSSNGYSIVYYLDTNVSNFISLVKKTELNTNILISNTQPSDTTKTWYQPLSNGSFKVFDYLNSIWTFVGISDSSSTTIQTDSLISLNSIACNNNDSAFIVSATSAESYVCNANVWSKISTGSPDPFNGDATILELATTLVAYPGSSIGRSTDPNSTPSIKNVFSGTKTFLKRDVEGTNGYWIDDTNNIIVGGNIADISTRSWPNGTYAYIPDTTNTNILLLQKISGVWMTIADGYDDVSKINITTQIVYDKKNNKYFKYSSNYWYEVNVGGTNLNTMYLTSHSNGRSIFPAPSSTSVKYLTLNNDCLSTTCYGSGATNYFAGEQLDNMYVYYYSTAGKRENNLLDATPSTSITDTYNRNLLASIIGNQIYVQSLDTLSRTCYTKPSDNTWWTKTGVAIPTGNNLPSSVDCSSATYTSGVYLNLGTRTDATNWTTAPDSALVYLTSIGVGYEHVSSPSPLDFWTNNGSGDGQTSATEIFTRGSRTSFPVVTHTINALTKLVDTPNNIVTGITSTIDNSFKQWYYATSGLNRVNNLTDTITITSQPYNSANTLAQSVGWAMYNSTIYYKSGILWKYQSNNTNWNPCGLLSNVGSYTNWTPDYTNLKCDRTIMSYTAKLSSISYVAATPNYSCSVGSLKSGTGNCFFKSGVVAWNSMISYCSGQGARLATSMEYCGTNSGTCSNFLGGQGGMNLYNPPSNVISNTMCVLAVNGPLYVTNNGFCNWNYAICTKPANVFYTCSSGTLSGAQCAITTYYCDTANGWSDNGANCKKITPQSQLFNSI